MIGYLTASCNLEFCPLTSKHAGPEMRITAIPALPWAVESAYIVSLVPAPNLVLSCSSSLVLAARPEKDLRLWLHEHDFDGAFLSARIDKVTPGPRLPARVKCCSSRLWRRMGFELPNKEEGCGCEIQSGKSVLHQYIRPRRGWRCAGERKISVLVLRR